jgi:hypothetical protein
MNRDTKRLKKVRKTIKFYELPFKDIEFGKAKRNGVPKISAIVLQYPDPKKKLLLHPTKGYRLQSIN